MTPEATQKFQALEDQAHDLMSYFCGVGFEMVAPSIIQPADVFLDAVGEDLRGRTYVFTDPEGSELCLRPDLTIPTCRLHWDRCSREGGTTLAQYCYNGPAFRFQPSGSRANTHPREYRQLGIERFGDRDREKSEIEILSVIVSALERAGLRDYTIRIGDLGIFHELLSAADLPSRWRERLRAHFWRPEAFRSELRQMTTKPDARIEGLPPELLSLIRGQEPLAAERILSVFLDEQGVDVIGTRSLSEVTESLLAALEDAEADALPEETAALIENYFQVAAPARAAGARLRDLMQQADIDIAPALDVFNTRLKHLSDTPIDPANVTFSAEFGRTLAYYTGFVFEVVSDMLGPESPVAGGGRYDSLMKMVGATTEVPAVGAMIHTERLLSAVSEAGNG
ncbi:MAG: ATP phosphoribosyltransferase regulatory subunit [Pseudomonadota bacterium]